MGFTILIGNVGKVIDIVGATVIIVGIALVSAYFVYSLSGSSPLTEAYERYRPGLGRALLLGLQVLVAADIIRTAANSPLLEGVRLLALFAVVRPFLSGSLEPELSRRWY